MAAVIEINDVIADSWFGGVSARYINYYLKEYKKETEILVKMNSPGGDVFEGSAIYNAFKSHSAKIIIEVHGLAASAASLICMAGDEIRMLKGTFMMIHEAWAFTQGPAEDHEKTGGLLRKINSEMADLYAARTGQSREKCLELMAANETWLTPDEAKSLGFADTVVAAKGQPKPTKAQAANAERVMALYKNVPQACRTLLTQTAVEDNPTKPAAQILKNGIYSPLGELSAYARYGK